MPTTFEIQEKHNPNNHEAIGLHLSFFEKKIRGTDTIECVVMAEEEGRDGVVVNDTTVFKSWTEMKKAFPTLKSLLIDFASSENWFASWRENKRVLYIESIEGNEGLYDVNQVVFYDYKDESSIVEFKDKTPKTEKSKKQKKM